MIFLAVQMCLVEENTIADINDLIQICKKIKSISFDALFCITPISVNGSCPHKSTQKRALEITKYLLLCCFIGARLSSPVIYRSHLAACSPALLKHKRKEISQ